MAKQLDHDKAIEALVEDLLDEALDLEADDLAVPNVLREEYEARRARTLITRFTSSILLTLQAEMIKLQHWVRLKLTPSF